MDANNSAVIVTGSSGLIGRAVCESLLKDGYRVAGFDRPGMPHPPRGVENIPCDITSDDSVTGALTRFRDVFGGTIASVIHLAAYYDFSGEPSPLYDRITVQGTARLMRALRRFTLEQFVFSSTMLVHAPCAPGQYIDEDWPLDPKWAYPQSKLETERLICAERGPVPVVPLRIAGVYTDDCESIPLAHQIQRIYERRLTAKVFPGETSHGQSFVHLDDVVAANLAVVANRAGLEAESIFLIGEPETLSYDELQHTFARLIHDQPEWDTIRIPKAAAKSGAWVQDVVPGVEEPFIKPWMIDLADDHYALNIDRARRLLAWTPRRTLRQTLPLMVDALERDPAAWYRRNKLEGAPPAREGEAGRARANR